MTVANLGVQYGTGWPILGGPCVGMQQLVILGW